MLPPAPGLASTMIGCPSFFDSPSAMMRDSVSAAPPAANPCSSPDRARRIIVGRRRGGCETTAKETAKKTAKQKNGRSKPLHPSHGCSPFDCYVVGRNSAAFFRSIANPLTGELGAFRRWRQTPDIARQPDPDLRPLRTIAVPGARLEIAELFIDHAIEIVEQLDQVPIGVAVIDGGVVSGAVTDRAPEDIESCGAPK